MSCSINESSTTSSEPKISQNQDKTIEPLNTKNTENFYKVWSQLISKKKIKCSSTLIKNWFAVDNIAQLRIANKEKKQIQI